MWVSATTYEIEGHRYAVCYRHLVRQIVTEDGTIPLLGFKLHPSVNDGDAERWLESVKLSVKGQPQVILASLDYEYANMVEVAESRFDARSFVLELGTVGQRLRLRPRIGPIRREFFPDSFLKPNDAYTLEFLDSLGPTQGQIDEARRRLAIWRRGGGRG